MDTSIFVVRPLHPQDGEALSTLHRRAIRHNHGQQFPAHVIEDWANSRTPDGYWRNHLKGENFLVATINDIPIGFIGWKNSELCGLYIDPDHQRKNIGSILVAGADVIATGKKEPIRTVITTSAHGFYEKHGFRYIRNDNFTVAGHTLPCTYMER